MGNIIIVLSISGKHEFKEKDQALKYIEQLSSFGEKYCLVLKTSSAPDNVYEMHHSDGFVGLGTEFDLWVTQQEYESNYLKSAMNKYKGGIL